MTSRMTMMWVFTINFKLEFFSLSRLNTVTATHADDINFSYRFEKQFRRSQISWIISGFPLGIVIVSLLLYKSYYWIGTKFLLLSASILILLSWVLTMPFGLVFWNWTRSHAFNQREAGKAFPHFNNLTNFVFLATTLKSCSERESSVVLAAESSLYSCRFIWRSWWGQSIMETLSTCWLLNSDLGSFRNISLVSLLTTLFRPWTCIVSFAIGFENEEKHHAMPLSNASAKKRTHVDARLSVDSFS